MKDFLKKSGFPLYLWALIFNIGTVWILLSYGGIDGFFSAAQSWVSSFLVIYLVVILGTITHGKFKHAILVFGIPCIIIFLVIYEANRGPTLNLITLLLLVIGRLLDIRMLKNIHPGV